MKKIDALEIPPVRKEMITFSKLKGAVQELTRRSFDEKHLGQIMTVYPESYELRRVRYSTIFVISPREALICDASCVRELGLCEPSMAVVA